MKSSMWVWISNSASSFSLLALSLVLSFPGTPQSQELVDMAAYISSIHIRGNEQLSDRALSGRMGIVLGDRMTSESLSKSKSLLLEGYPEVSVRGYLGGSRSVPKVPRLGGGSGNSTHRSVFAVLTS